MLSSKDHRADGREGKENSCFQLSPSKRNCPGADAELRRVVDAVRSASRDAPFGPALPIEGIGHPIHLEQGSARRDAKVTRSALQRQPPSGARSHGRP